MAKLACKPHHYSVHAAIDAKLNSIIELVVNLDLKDDIDYGEKGKEIGQAICKAGVASGCYSSTSIEKALALPIKDMEWKWDRFQRPNRYDNIWACRGTSRGQFVEEYKCANEFKTDDTWPNN
ncbi:hypothetical protein MTsDn5_02920 [Alteromonas gracilis]|uniref:hypothetical protein n=1 Tax=Alteromonas gracilis TaxID=1479524 RepID=UPI0036F1F2D9